MIELAPLSVDELLAVKYPANVVIGADILDIGGYMMVVGPTSVGKSYFLLQLAMNLAKGTSVLNQWPVPKAFTVYLVQAEIGLKRFQSRVEKLWANFSRLPNLGGRLLLESPYDLKLDRPEGLKAVEKVVDQEGVEVLIIDPMRPFHTGNENASEEMERLFTALLVLRFGRGVSLIVSHHDRKPSTERKGRSIYEVRGNTVITDRPDTIFRLNPQKGGLTVEVVCEKLRNADQVLPSQIWSGDRTTGLFTLSVKEHRPADRTTSVRELLSGGGLTLRELANGVSLTLGVSLKSAYAVIDDAAKKGIVEKSASADGHNEKIVTLVGEK